MVAAGWVPAGPGSPRQYQLWLGWEEGRVSHNPPLYSPSRANQRMRISIVGSLLKNSTVSIHTIPYLCRVAIRLSCCCLTALLHGWRRRGRWWEALSADSGDLKQWYSRVEVHGDLRRHAIRCCRLQTDRQGSSRALHGVVMVKNIQLRRNHVHHRDRSVTRDCRGRRLAFSGIWRTRKTTIKNLSGRMCHPV